jgi:hypothetical protein
LGWGDRHDSAPKRKRFFLKKEPKNFCSRGMGGVAHTAHAPAEKSLFASFSSEKEGLA